MNLYVKYKKIRGRININMHFDQKIIFNIVKWIKTYTFINKIIYVHREHHG